MQEVNSALNLTKLYQGGSASIEEWVEDLNEMHFANMANPRLKIAYDQRLKAIDDFIKVAVKLDCRNIPGVTDPFKLAKAPKTKFKPNTLIL